MISILSRCNQVSAAVRVRWAGSSTAKHVPAPTDFVAETEKLMSSNLSYLQSELGKLRCGRASPGMLESLNVDAYGSKMPLVSLSTISVRNTNLLHIKPHDFSLCGDIKRAIDASGYGFNAFVSGDSVSIPVPKVSKEARENLAKLAAAKAEKTKVDVRRSRKVGLDKIKEFEDSISEDEVFRLEKKIQTLTDSYIEKVSKLVQNKLSELKSN